MVLLIGRVGNFASTNQKYYPNLGKCVIANEQPREDARLRGSSIVKAVRGSSIGRMNLEAM